MARTGAGFHSKPNEVSVSGGHIFLIWPPSHFFVEASGPEELVIYTLIMLKHISMIFQFFPIFIFYSVNGNAKPVCEEQCRAPDIYYTHCYFQGFIIYDKEVGSE